MACGVLQEPVAEPRACSSRSPPSPSPLRTPTLRGGQRLEDEGLERRRRNVRIREAEPHQLVTKQIEEEKHVHALASLRHRLHSVQAENADNIEKAERAMSRLRAQIKSCKGACEILTVKVREQEAANTVLVGQYEQLQAACAALDYNNDEQDAAAHAVTAAATADREAVSGDRGRELLAMSLREVELLRMEVDAESKATMGLEDEVLTLRRQLTKNERMELAKEAAGRGLPLARIHLAADAFACLQTRTKLVKAARAFYFKSGRRSLEVVLGPGASGSSEALPRLGASEMRVSVQRPQNSWRG